MNYYLAKVWFTYKTNGGTEIEHYQTKLVSASSKGNAKVAVVNQYKYDEDNGYISNLKVSIDDTINGY